jgi:hypothetical protein
VTVAELIKELSIADPDAEVCCGPGLRLLGDVHVVHGVPGQMLPYVALLAAERVEA